MIGPLLDHLWQSTLFAGACGLLVIMLRNNSAKIRFWVWFAASVKFLVSFRALTLLSGLVIAPRWTPFPAPAMSAIAPAATLIQPGAGAFALSPPLGQVPHASDLNLVPFLIAAWVLGAGAIAAYRFAGLHRLNRLLRRATELPVPAPVKVLGVPASLEPGLAGIWHPVILLPAGIETRLSPDGMAAILVHEVCHLRRRDNLLAAIHMMVETLFWFHPLVWWLGKRLDQERERACDEMVLEQGSSPQVYAESILHVCKFHVAAPFSCAAGGDLKKRVAAILENRLIANLGGAKKAVLAGAVATVMAVPVAAAMVGPADMLATSNPGTEAALRRQVTALERHRIDVANLTPRTVEAFLQQRDQVQQEIDRWGALKSIAFAGKNHDWDIYSVAFAHERTSWQIAPLTKDGKIRGIIWGRADITAPSPGTENAVRRQIEGWERHRPDLDDLTPALAARAYANRASIEKQFDRWGPLKSLTFEKVNPNNLDVYDAVFARGHAVFWIHPLTAEGKADMVAFSSVFNHPTHGASPGTERALRHQIKALEHGAPDYGQMTAVLAASIRANLPAALGQIKRWGALKAIQFETVGAEGADYYDVTFSHAHANWHIAPLTADGKIQTLSFHD